MIYDIRFQNLLSFDIFQIIILNQAVATTASYNLFIHVSCDECHSQLKPYIVKVNLKFIIINRFYV